MKLSSAASLVLAAITVAAPATAPAQTVAAVIDASKTGAPISPYVFGQFLEHVGNLVYSSLWSEMLDDRKFYYPVGPAPANEPDSASRGFRGRRRGIGPGRWNPVGPADSVVMDTNNPFVGEHTPRIELAGSEPRGIRQTGVRFIKGETYQGRIQLAGDPDARVTINLVWGTNADAPRQTVPLGASGGQYRKFNFSFKAAESGAAQFEIVGTGSGSFHVGAVSLMPAGNLDGWRPAEIAVLKSLHSGVYRFPGGNYVSAFEWHYAIGDPDKRPPVFDPVWHALQPNDIGPDEFVTMCKLLGVEPYITVNAGTGDDWSARELVEYCNGDASTPMGKLRAANGHPEPYHVKFWGIGNEMWGITYQYGAMKLSQFEYKHNQFARAMKEVDPAIKLIASGAMPDTMTGSRESLSLGTNLVPPYLSPEDWTGNLLEHCFDNIDLISEHFYNYGNTHFSLAEGKQVPNDPNEPVTDWMRRPANHIRIKYEEYQEYEKLLPQLAAHPKPLNIDEWAYMGGRYPTYPSYAWVVSRNVPAFGCFPNGGLHLRHVFAGPRWNERHSQRQRPRLQNLSRPLWHHSGRSLRQLAPAQTHRSTRRRTTPGQRRQPDVSAGRGCCLDHGSSRVDSSRSESHQCRATSRTADWRSESLRQRHPVAAGVRGNQRPEPRNQRDIPWIQFLNRSGCRHSA